MKDETVTQERLWAPWRLAYVQGDSQGKAEPKKESELLPGADPDCFLCQSVIVAEAASRHVVRQTAHSVVVLNRFPYNNGHLLVAPRRHCAGLEELRPDEQLDLFQEIAHMIAALGKILHPEGYNVGLNLGRAAGAGLPGHLHWHIVPRWVGDTNFMPALAAVKVIPQSLQTLWEMLTAELAKSSI
jgi:ATP adenylyltransferase